MLFNINKESLALMFIVFKRKIILKIKNEIKFDKGLMYAKMK